jgi:hypothetical protein
MAESRNEKRAHQHLYPHRCKTRHFKQPSAQLSARIRQNARALDSEGATFSPSSEQRKDGINHI